MMDMELRTAHTPEHHAPIVHPAGKHSFAALREFWQAQPRPDNPHGNTSDEPVTNLAKTLHERAIAKAEATQSVAIEAWQKRQAGATMKQLAQEYHVKYETLIHHWYKLGYKYEPFPPGGMERVNQ